jgi:type IV pilus assembly protein PilE
MAGFTLIELMIVVAIVAILAAVVVPSFFREAQKTKGAAEVGPMFAELATRQEAYKVENGVYLSTSAAEGTTFPAATAGTTAQDLTASPPATWASLKVQPPVAMARCVYVSMAGAGGDASNIGAQATVFGFTAPGVAWYYLLARCDLDNDSGVDSWYFQSSVDPTLRKLNPGH